MKKIIPPIIITVLIVAYLLFFAIGIIIVPEIGILKILGIIIPLVFAGYSVFALIDRIEEIRSGEKDDLGKY